MDAPLVLGADPARYGGTVGTPLDRVQGLVGTHLIGRLWVPRVLPWPGFWITLSGAVGPAGAHLALRSVSHQGPPGRAVTQGKPTLRLSASLCVFPPLFPSLIFNLIICVKIWRRSSSQWRGRGPGLHLLIKAPQFGVSGLQPEEGDVCAPQESWGEFWMGGE